MCTDVYSEQSATTISAVAEQGSEVLETADDRYEQSLIDTSASEDQISKISVAADVYREQPVTALSTLAEQSVKISVVALLRKEQSATVTSRKKPERDSGSGLVCPHAHDKGMKIIGTLQL